MPNHGTVEAIFLATRNGGPPHSVAMAVAHPGRGLAGDRHFDDPGACDVSLIEAEALDALKAEHGVELGPGGSRRQVHVRGLDLGDLIGRSFRIGDVECEGEERCEPCQHLVGVVGTNVVLSSLLHTGLRARVLTGGIIRAGDVVALVDQPALVED